MPINNIFDFVDYLEGFQQASGTANENRAFIYNSMAQVFGELNSTWDLYSAYKDIGISIPQATFDNIIELIGEGKTNGNMIQAFAPTSNVNIQGIPGYDGDIDTDYIVYSEALVFNPVTGDSFVEEWYHKFDDVLSTAQLREQVALDI